MFDLCSLKKIPDAFFPLPLAGRGQGWGSTRADLMRLRNNVVLGNLEELPNGMQSALPPTPDPSPQGGGEKRPRRPRQPRRPRKELN
jgi:hypothetical protein